jgi:hypothetical protein
VGEINHAHHAKNQVMPVAISAQIAPLMMPFVKSWANKSTDASPA